ncbi:MAG: hypothetical protein AAF517_21180 [Planctomycetota bacterium]
MKIVTIASALGAAAFLAALEPLQKRRVLGILATCGVLSWTPQWIEILGTSKDSIVSAERELRQILPKGARVAGPFSHALTWESDIQAEQMNHLRYGKGRLKKRFEREGWTHLIYDRPKHPEAFRQVFERDGVPLRLIDVYSVRGTEVHLYRVGTSTLPENRFERARRLAKAGDAEAAIDAALDFLDLDAPNSASAWSFIGDLEFRRGNLPIAYHAFQTALQRDPWRVQAHLAMIELSERNRQPERALLHARAACESAWRDEKLLSQLRPIIRSLEANLTTPPSGFFPEAYAEPSRGEADSKKSTR